MKPPIAFEAFGTVTGQCPDSRPDTTDESVHPIRISTPQSLETLRQEWRKAISVFQDHRGSSNPFRAPIPIYDVTFPEPMPPNPPRLEGGRSDFRVFDHAKPQRFPHFETQNTPMAYSDDTTGCKRTRRRLQGLMLPNSPQLEGVRIRISEPCQAVRIPTMQNPSVFEAFWTQTCNLQVRS